MGELRRLATNVKEHGELEEGEEEEMKEIEDRTRKTMNALIQE